MNDLVNTINQSLGMAIFIRSSDGKLSLQSSAPKWLCQFISESQPGSTLEAGNIFPYLSYFLDDAEQHWHSKNGIPLMSGPWVEINGSGEEVPLEARALNVDGQAVLIIEHLGERYYQEVIKLQKVRNSLLEQEKLEKEVRKRTQMIRQREEEIAIKLVSLTSYRDEETGAHVKRIGMYAAAMARALKWPRQHVDDIRIAAPMHDIGKIAIPDNILLKKGRLSVDEFETMKCHAEFGAKMLEGSGISMLDMAAEIARNHHEKWDGSGYPKGLVGHDIPISARITAIVDVYDALVHERVYKEAIEEAEALAIMQNMSGSHFDPDLFELFLELLPEMREIRAEVKDEVFHSEAEIIKVC